MRIRPGRDGWYEVSLRLWLPEDQGPEPMLSGRLTPESHQTVRLPESCVVGLRLCVDGEIERGEVDDAADS